MLKGVGVITDITLHRRGMFAAEVSADMCGATPPLFHPAISAADGEREASYLLCASGGIAPSD
jgi:hypothetical protein